MLCSVLITTRKRVPRLLNTLRSVRDAASSQDNFEVWLRLDEDDTETQGCLQECSSIINNFHYIVGPRLGGWGSVYAFWDELYKKCSGTWVWMISDDMLVTGTNWDVLLNEIPTDGFIVHPQIHQLGPSIYPDDIGGPTPLLPRGALEGFGFAGIPDPPDTGINDTFRRKSGWRTRFLLGVGIWHQRDDELTLVKDRMK